MLKLTFNKDDSFLYQKKIKRHLGEYLKKMTPNSDLQFIHKKSGNSMTTAFLIFFYLTLFSKINTCITDNDVTYIIMPRIAQESS